MARERDRPDRVPESPTRAPDAVATGGNEVAATDPRGSAEIGTGEPTQASGRRRNLIDDVVAERLQISWSEVQQRFVDDPRGATDQAADLVQSAADRIGSVIRDQLSQLSRHTLGDAVRDTEAETEQLRGLMRRYRQLLDRLLTA